MKGVRERERSVSYPITPIAIRTKHTHAQTRTSSSQVRVKSLRFPLKIINNLYS